MNRETSHQFFYRLFSVRARKLLSVPRVFLISWRLIPLLNSLKKIPLIIMQREFSLLHFPYPGIPICLLTRKAIVWFFNYWTNHPESNRTVSLHESFFLKRLAWDLVVVWFWHGLVEWLFVSITISYFKCPRLGSWHRNYSILPFCLCNLA